MCQQSVLVSSQAERAECSGNRVSGIDMSSLSEPLLESHSGDLPV